MISDSPPLDAADDELEDDDGDRVEHLDGEVDEELRAAIARVAIHALVDALRAVINDRRRVKVLTVEVELKRGRPTGGRAWVEFDIDKFIKETLQRKR